MRVIANLGKLSDLYTALIIDNPYFPYYIVNGYNGEIEGDNLWAATANYYSNIFDFAKAITGYEKDGIGYHRLDEIASKAIDGLFEFDENEAKYYCESELDLDKREREYFCVDNKGEESDDDDDEDWL